MSHGGETVSTPVAVNSLQVKPSGSPDELRTPDKTRLEVVRLDGYTVGRMTL